ncbi:uncharacterized protein LOC107269218 [Cephus cinctus]|uniref:Uncharacterized protein LOC107269218 n=1 Tax=Cephus cinctus TaxID=211228 RepID=A0AAJ7BZU2_CEPCN|nr:uncharacterized protein LOC107269218 [Cephus cinctus]
MRVNHGIVASRGIVTLTTTTRTLIFIVVFCFASCAAGSCLSYGHSCWGAHGKRSGNFENSPTRSGLTQNSKNDADQEAALPSLDDQWILSRMVTRQFHVPSSAKFHTKWYDVPKMKLLPRKWDNENSEIVAENQNYPHRYRADDEDDEQDGENENEMNMQNGQQIRSESTDPRDETDEVLLLPSQKEYGKRLRKSRILRFFKLLNNDIEKLE